MEAASKGNNNMPVRVLAGAIAGCYLLTALGARTVGNNATAQALSWLCLWPDAALALQRPWALLSYAFIQTGFMHIALNLCWLGFFGRIALKNCSPKAFYTVFAASTVCGGVAFVLFSTLLGHTAAGPLAGASAGIMGITASIPVWAANSSVNLPLVGNTKITKLLIVVALLFLAGLSSANAGGNAAHIGGIAAGLACAVSIKRRAARTAMLKSKSNEMHRIGNQMFSSGFESLSKEEKEKIFNSSAKA